jgi:hypothetical protein
MYLSDKEMHRKLDYIIERINHMSTQLDALTAQVQANTTVEASAVTMIKGIASQISTAVAAGDSAQLTTLASQLNASASSLSAAILANTPVVTVTSTTVGTTVTGTTVTTAPVTSTGTVVSAVKIA